jgi:hypothetical protein
VDGRLFGCIGDHCVHCLDSSRGDVRLCVRCEEGLRGFRIAEPVLKSLRREDGVVNDRFTC